MKIISAKTEENPYIKPQDMQIGKLYRSNISDSYCIVVHEHGTEDQIFVNLTYNTAHKMHKNELYSFKVQLMKEDIIIKTEE